MTPGLYGRYGASVKTDCPVQNSPGGQDAKSASALQSDRLVGTRGWRASLASVSAVINAITIIRGDADELSLITDLTGTKKPVVIAFINQHALNLAWSSSDFAACLANSDVLLRDGIGIEACLTILGQSPGRNMNGTDFIPKLAAAFAGRRIGLYGTQEPWTGKAADALAKLGCRVVGTMDGFQPEEDYVAEAMRSSPELVILAMGNPKQEIVARMIAASAVAPMVVVNGGAIADFLGERFERAPVWLRRARCEWVFRMLQEPRRLWRRYIVGAFAFARSVTLLRLVWR
jgi:exopolysaccharide biosynthesis WecB/TagA/CpsF family protein